MAIGYARNFAREKISSFVVSIEIFNRHSPVIRRIEARIALSNDLGNGQQHPSPTRGIQTR